MYRQVRERIITAEVRKLERRQAMERENRSSADRPHTPGARDIHRSAEQGPR